MARKHTETKKSRDTFYIITNGEKTEKNYFSLLKKKKSIYDVKVLSKVLDPLRLIEYATQFTKDANQVWCVFDVDSSQEEGRFVPAIYLAEKSGIKIAFSNKAFEVWLISHYKQCNKKMDCCEHIKELNKYLQEIAKKQYNKVDCNILDKYFIPNYKIAVQNSKIVYQKRMKEHREQYGENSRPRVWEWNSSTNVFKLIEALKLQE